MKRLFIVICLFIWMPIPAMGGWFGPSNYEECILKNMKGVASDDAVRAIKRACRVKFPLKKPKLRDVPKKVLEDITGKAWFIDKTHLDASRTCNFYAELFNKNAKWSIHLIKMRIIDKATGTYEDVLGMDEQTQRYLDAGRAYIKETNHPLGRVTPTREQLIMFGKEKEQLMEKKHGFFKRLTSTLGGLVDTDKSKCFGFFVQKVPEKWEWNIIGAKGWSKP